MSEQDELTPQEWQYISILIAQDVRTDRAAEIHISADMHLAVWEKVQPMCRWDEAWDEES